MHLASVALAYSPVDVLEVSIGLPALVIDARNGLRDPPCRGTVTGTHLGWSDPQLRVRWRVLDLYGVVVSLRGGLHPPLATLQTEIGALLGDQWGSATLGATLGARHGRLQGIVDVGMVVRPFPDAIPIGLYDTTLQDEVTFGGGLQANVAWGFAVAAELSGRYVEVVYQRSGQRQTHLPLEVIGGLKYKAGDFEVTLGAGAGLSTGYGTPRARIVSSVSYTGEGLLPLDWLRRLPKWTPDFDVNLRGVDDEIGKLRATRLRWDPPPPPEPRPDSQCPEPESLEARLVIVPGCPRPPEHVPPAGDDENRNDPTVEVLEDPTMKPSAPGDEPSTTREIVLVIHLLFGHDADSLAPGERERLIREVTDPPPGAELVAVSVRAHADASGDSDYNDSLSMRRAANVAAVLEHAGVPARIIRQEARGARDPLLRDTMHDANRRVRVGLHYRIQAEEP